ILILASIYSSGQYSDFTITCKGKRFQVHKAIVCPRSGFFAAALRTDFKEACEGIVDLSSDDLGIVEIIIHYFYHLDYELLPQRCHADTGTNEFEQPLCLSTHAKVYSLAEKYVITGLKALALEKFKTATSKHWETHDLLGAAKEAYASTLETDRELKNAVVRAFYARSKLLEHKEVQELFQELHALAYDLLMYVSLEKRTF
ncbi:unnamed protein product, partial [Clonostachys chloroleuca]